MALCRFSDFQCDLYIYESERGIECYVATQRYENEPEPPAFPPGVDTAQWDLFWRDYQAYKAEIEAARLAPIGLPADGTGETFGDWGQVLAHVLHLRSLGYQVPDWVINSIKEEADPPA